MRTSMRLATAMAIGLVATGGAAAAETTVKTSYGAFTFDTYEPYDSAPTAGQGTNKNAGVDAIISFLPDISSSDDIKIVQLYNYDPTQYPNQRAEDRATVTGWTVDTTNQSIPWYGVRDDGTAKEADIRRTNATEAWKKEFKRSMDPVIFKLGYKREGTSRATPAMLSDIPRWAPARVGTQYTVRLVTIAVDVEHSMYLGGVEWGFDIAADGKLTARTPKLAFKANPSGDYLKALTNWNAQSGNTAVPVPP
jgi:hypothetical protein